MLENLLRYFPENIYPLFLVFDPDCLLNEESVLAALSERGCTLFDETDPISLRYRFEALKPLGASAPIIIRSENQLNTLPFDIWQQGHKVKLGLNTFFPNLAYPVLQQLTPNQVWRLGQFPSPSKKLGQKGSIEFILKQVFEIDLPNSNSLAETIIWLNRLHQSTDKLPKLFKNHILQKLENKTSIQNLEELLINKEAFINFLQEQWSGFVKRKTGESIREPTGEYVLDFENHLVLQDQLSTLIRSGNLAPVKVFDPDSIPFWAKSGVLAIDEDPNLVRLKELITALNEISDQELSVYRWGEWQSLAYILAETISLSGVTKSDASTTDNNMQNSFDKSFLTWLEKRYSVLGANKLPQPHHLFHIPHYIAYQRRQQKAKKVALVIMDGMALADWQVIGKAWRSRNPNWIFYETLVMAQIPTMTSISRQALVSGLRPVDFSESLRDNHAEYTLWRAFWQNESVSPDNCAYERHKPNAGSDWIDKPRLEAVCLIDNSIDDLMHNTLLGLSDFYSSLEIWLENDSIALEQVIGNLLSQGFVIYLTSDHGHVEAQGFGVLMEGLTVQTRSKRARVYNDLNIAEQNRQKVSPSFIWSDDGLLPDNIYTLMPEGNFAFVPHDEIVIAHGGASISEIIVPLVSISLD